MNSVPYLSVYTYLISISLPLEANFLPLCRFHVFRFAEYVLYLHPFCLSVLLAIIKPYCKSKAVFPEEIVRFMFHFKYFCHIIFPRTKLTKVFKFAVMWYPCTFLHSQIIKLLFIITYSSYPTQRTV